MKFINTKLTTIISGLLTLSGLAMLFSGLIVQMTESSDFNTVNQSLASADSTIALIGGGVLMMIIFGMLFFNSWARMNNKHAKCVKLA